MQTWLVLPEADTSGNGCTVSVTAGELELTQPAVLVPVTVYEVLTEGVTVRMAGFGVPFHVYEFAPDAVKVAATPSHTSVVDDVIDNTGRLCTVTVTAATLVLVHPAVLVPETE